MASLSEREFLWVAQRSGGLFSAAARRSRPAQAASAPLYGLWHSCRNLRDRALPRP